MKPQTEERFLGKTQIPVQDTFWVMDSSKIQRFMDCPRGFFFSHILGWQSTDPNIHLVFGSAWHEAMEHLLTNEPTAKIVDEAHQKFLKLYNKEFAADPFSTEHRSKNPGNALRSLMEYARDFPHDPKNTIYTEVAGSCEIAPDRDIYFKMDTIRRHPAGHQEAGKYYSLEHKTTSRKTSSWMNKWTYKFQVGCYIHALNMWLDDPAKLDGLTINGSIFRTKDTEHVKIPIRKSGPQMLEWLHEANYWFDMYLRELEKLAEVDPNDPVMVAFPRNTEACSKFGCKFLGLCNTRPNPCRDLSVPNGYERDFWDPRARGQDANYELQTDMSGKSSMKKIEKEEEDDSNDEGLTL